MTVSLATQKGRETADPAFAREVMEKSGAHLERCYQCVACSSGCPFAFAFDYAPHQLLRMVQLGLKDRVLDSTTVWLCASCETCATRCPNDIQIVHVMDTLRERSLSEGRTGQTRLPLFHRIFLSGIRSNGKIHELSLILRYTLASGDLRKVKKLSRDALMGARMFAKGKLVVLPDRIKGMTQIRRIFQETEKGNG